MQKTIEKLITNIKMDFMGHYNAFLDLKLTPQKMKLYVCVQNVIHKVEYVKTQL